MKKRIIILSIICVVATIIGFCMAKVAFVEANDDDPNTVELTSKEEALNYGANYQAKTDGGYEPLTDNEKNQFQKFVDSKDLIKGDLNSDGQVNVNDAEIALRLYTNIIVSKSEDAQITKLELFSGDIDGDNRVDNIDAQTILKYVSAKLVYPTQELKDIAQYRND